MNAYEEGIVVADPPEYPGVRVLTLSRPDKRNAFDTAMYDAFTAAMRTARDDDATKVVVITGAGATFSAGQDLQELARIAEQHAAGEPVTSGFRDAVDSVAQFDKPLLVAVNGAAVGWGFTMLPYADLVLVGESARMKVPFATYGVPPEAGSSYLLPARLGWQRAARVLFTGDWLTAREAVESGLALECVADDELLPRAMTLAAQIATARVDALRTIKRLMQRAEHDAIDAALTAESAAYAETLGAATISTTP